MIPLYQLNEGERGQIVAIIRGNGCRHCQKPRKKRFFNRIDHPKPMGRFEDLGIRIGKTIELVQKRAHGPILIKIDDSRFAIGRQMVERIMVNVEN